MYVCLNIFVTVLCMFTYAMKLFFKQLSFCKADASPLYKFRVFVSIVLCEIYRCFVCVV